MKRTPDQRNRIIEGDNLAVLSRLPDASVDLIYIDPPFNTGRRQKRVRIRAIHDENGGDRTGFQGKRYRSEAVSEHGFDDSWNDYAAFLEPRLREAFRILRPCGSFFLHLDCREVHYLKVLLDGIFGRASFQNEIIWSYDFGGRSRKRWPAKHDNILWYAKDPRRYTFHYDAIDRIPYMAPGLVGPEKAARGKTPTDVWWQTIVPTNGKEKCSFPTQKPVAILNRIVRVHSNPGDLVCDFFAGSGTTGEAAGRLGRRFLLIDHDPKAVKVMKKRLAFADPVCTRWGRGSRG
ncbi:MAG: site-specific DNA-methyltransferase [Candidatus Eisenbacteria bacterium]|nr:site-specific DNA-methyltransferase [Candidatus Eisenbacteria bacterium]